MDTRETALLLFVEMEKTKNFGSSLIRDTLNKYGNDFNARGSDNSIRFKCIFTEVYE